MSLTSAATRILYQLSDVVSQMRPLDFSRPSARLGGATIGQHIRHTLEFFNCLEAGIRNGDGVVNYDKRDHDKVIETDKDLALAAIENVIEFVGTLHRAETLRLQVGYDQVEEEHLAVDTNSFRELVYNIEHAVHHMAIIKIGLSEIAPYVTLGEDFGVAVSTLRYGRRREPVARNSNGDATP